MSFRIDLQPAEHGDIDMAAADQRERHRAVEGRRSRQCADRPAAGVGQKRMRHALLGDRSGADQAVLRLEKHVEARRHVVRDQGRDADAEIDQVSRAKLERHAFRDNRLGIHGFTRWQ